LSLEHAFVKVGVDLEKLAELLDGGVPPHWIREDREEVTSCLGGEGLGYEIVGESKPAIRVRSPFVGMLGGEGQAVVNSCNMKMRCGVLAAA
jgi:hypothetical protein